LLSAATSIAAAEEMAGQSETGPEENAALVREIDVIGRNLLIPVHHIATKEGMTRLSVLVDGTLFHNVDVKLATGDEDVGWWGYLDMSDAIGKTAVLKVVHLEPGSRGLEMIESSDKQRNLHPLYDEKMRPQFHFSQMRGWNNDPNGMVYYKGRYHLFWQSNPLGNYWMNMYWGHASSSDMVHWTEHPHAIRPQGGTVKDRHPAMASRRCFSGSANVDKGNTAGWQVGDEKVIVAAFTDYGYGEALVYSNDAGMSWKYYEGNPIFKHGGNDPKLVWYEPGQHWVIAVFNHEKSESGIAFYSSKDLKTWTRTSKVNGFWECPELFELPADGDKTNTRWVIWGGDAKYMVGKFDGKVFTPEHEGKHQVHWGSYYASQCFSNPPDGRVVQIGWAKFNITSEMPFNQTFSLPTNLTLRTTKNGLRLFANPVKELEILREPHPQVIKEKEVAHGKSFELPVEGQLFDINITLKRGSAKDVAIHFGDKGANSVAYSFTQERVDEMPAAMQDGKITLRILVDRPMYEVVGGGGQCYKTAARRDPGEPLKNIRISAYGGTVTVESLEVYKMKSAWKTVRTQ
jgi:fructan beta-fructosidase